MGCMEHGRAARSGARLRLVTSGSHSRGGERTLALLFGDRRWRIAALAATGAARSIIEYGVHGTPQAERRPRCCRAARNNTAPLSTGWAHFWNLEGTLHQSHAVNRHNSLSRNQLDSQLFLACHWGQVLTLNFGSSRSMIVAPRIKGFTNRLRPSEPRKGR